MAFVQVGGVDAERPTFFEVIATERLMLSLKAAIGYSLSVYSRHRPNLERLLTHEDELFFLVSVLLDRHALQSDASFAESLYGLKRTVRQPPTGGTPQHRAMTQTHRTSSLMLLTLVPYLRSKLDTLYASSVFAAPPPPLSLFNARTQGVFTPETPPLTQLQSFARILALWLIRKGYPFVAAAHEAARFSYQLFYMLGRSPFSSPELHALGLVLTRVSGQDVAAAGRRRDAALRERLASAGGGSGGPLLRLLRESWVRLGSAAAEHTRSALILAVFGYKLLEWWYTSAEQKIGGNEAPPPPPPPPAPLVSPRSVPLPEDRSVCPLCCKQRTNPAMIATSGFVFCYPCAFKYVQGNQKCPVTMTPARVDHIRRLYLQ